MNIKFIFSLHLLLIAGTLQAQKTTISGTVKNKKNEPHIVNITIQPKGSQTISAFTLTDANGKYVITFEGKADSLEVVATGFNVGRHSRVVPNRSSEVHFVVEETAIELGRVIITLPKISQRGDTINFNVGAYSDQSDRVISDVLKKMPGIKVSESGSISYNGRNINKFYVEDLDLLQGRYGIATENISAKDVAMVQVLENHQPIKALRDKIISDNPALNLKLKQSAKGTLAVTGLAGLGYRPLLWEGELTALYFAKKNQNITTNKSNNTGKNILSELNAHYDYERVYVGGGSMLSVQSPSSPPIPEKRYRKNQSHAISSNQLVKINDDLELTANLVYYNDRTSKEGYSRNEQFLSADSKLLIEERIATASKINNAEISLRLNSNATDYFFNNVLNLKGNWNELTGTGNTFSNVKEANEHITQHLNRPSFSADNTMNWIKNIKNNSINIYFSTGYAEMPHTLSVSPADFFGNGNFSSLTQNIFSKDMASTLRLSYGMRLGNFILDYSLSENVSLKNIETELERTDKQNSLLPAPDSLKNKLDYNNYQTTLNQSYTYQNGGLKTSLNLPLTYYILTIDDRISSRFRPNMKWIFSPSLSVNYDLSGYWQVSARGAYGKSFGNVNDAYTGFILHNYRSLVRNTIEDLYETRSGSGSANIRYSNPLNAFFAGGGVNYRRTWRNLLYGYNYQGVMSVKTVLEKPTQSDGYGVNVYSQKAFDFWQSNIRVNSNYNTGRGEMLIQETKYNYRSVSYGAGTDINFYPHSKLGVNYGFSWYQSRSFTEVNANRFPPINSISQNLKMNVFPIKELTISLFGEYQYNSATSNKNIYFADASLTFKKKMLDLEMEINNLFNTKQYISATYSDISSYYYSSLLRPFSVLVRARFKIK